MPPHPTGGPLDGEYKTRQDLLCSTVGLLSNSRTTGKTRTCHSVVFIKAYNYTPYSLHSSELLRGSNETLVMRYFENWRALHECWVLLLPNTLEKFFCSSFSILCNSRLSSEASSLPHKYLIVKLHTCTSAGWSCSDQASFGCEPQKPITESRNPETGCAGSRQGSPREQRKGCSSSQGLGDVGSALTLPRHVSPAPALVSVSLDLAWRTDLSFPRQPGRSHVGENVAASRCNFAAPEEGERPHVGPGEGL